SAAHECEQKEQSQAGRCLFHSSVPCVLLGWGDQGPSPPFFYRNAQLKFPNYSQNFFSTRGPTFETRRGFRNSGIFNFSELGYFKNPNLRPNSAASDIGGSRITDARPASDSSPGHLLQPFRVSSAFDFDLCR